MLRNKPSFKRNCWIQSLHLLFFSLLLLLLLLFFAFLVYLLLCSAWRIDSTRQRLFKWSCSRIYMLAGRSKQPSLTLTAFVICAIFQIFVLAVFVHFFRFGSSKPKQMPTNVEECAQGPARYLSRTLPAARRRPQLWFHYQIVDIYATGSRIDSTWLLWNKRRATELVLDWNRNLDSRSGICSSLVRAKLSLEDESFHAVQWPAAWLSSLYKFVS